MIVDAHAHVFGPAALDGRGVDALVPADREAPIEGLRAQMRTARVANAVLVPIDEHDGCVAEALAADPRRYAAIAVAGTAGEGRDPDVGALATMRCRRAAFPFHGVRVCRLGDPSVPLSQSPAMPMLRWLSDQGLILWSYLSPDQLPLLLQLPEELPDLDVVLNHLGFFPYDMRVDSFGRPRFEYPLPEERVRAVLGLAIHERVHVMISGQYALSTQPHPHHDLDEIVRRIVSAFGAQRCLWGSDYPWIKEVPGYAQTLGLLESALPDASSEELCDIREGTARRLFPHLEEDDDDEER